MQTFPILPMALAVLLSAAFALAQSDMEKPELPEILALWTPYQESLKSVARDRDGKIDSLDRSYLANLDKRQKEAIAAGNLDDTLAIKSERERIVAHEATTDEQRKAMGLALAKLQGSYDTALKAYAVEMIKREGVLQQKYVADLEALQKRVTTSGDLDKALRVKVERERVATGLSAALREANSTKDPWINLFNGRDLTGWAGVPQFWSVKNGVIIGKSTMDTPNNTGNTFLVWQGGKVSDFEFSCKYKLEANNADGTANSGIQFRAFTTEPGKFAITGYQVELDAGTIHPPAWPSMANINGCLSSDGKDERLGVGIIAAVGQKVVARPVSTGPASVTATGQLGKDQDFADLYKPNNWNEVRLVAIGNHIQIFINGRQTVDATDESNRYTSGLLGLQLQGPQAFKTVQFKDLKLRHIR